MQTATAWT